MDKINFSDIMKFYPEHNYSVYEELKSAYQRRCIIPFVGAGLSAFCGYLGWTDVLRELAKYIYNHNLQDEIKEMIEDGKLLQAAQSIQENYPRMLKELQKIIDYDKIKNCDNNEFYASAAYVLPYLFSSGFVITTNFDRVLEEVYDRCHVKFGKVITPYEPDLLTQSRQGNPHCLFKLHGDIGPEIHDIERLVFTQAQYDKEYANDGALMQELPQWFQNKTLLFLGCSLEKDRTMQVLQQVTNKSPGLDHYAILACHSDEISKRCVEMGDLGISAIFYPYKRHEAVRIILERLLEDTDYTAYEQLNVYDKKSVYVSKSAHHFMYDSDYVAFVGREKELRQLKEFCQNSEQISWWAVTGPGGMGKSRLIYEFTNAQKAEDWKVCWLKHSDYDDLIHWTPPADRCIVVADDVQAYLQTVGAWIVSISIRLRSEKLKIILLERDGKDMNSAKWVELMQSKFPYDDTISSKCYSSDFLNLTPLSDAELKAIITNFAEASGKPLQHSEDVEHLLQSLKKIDDGLYRPMYALAITDAWCSGEDPAHWSKEQVLNALTRRELKFYYERLLSLSQDKISDGVRYELESLLAQSCQVSFLPIEKIVDTEFPKLRKMADKLDMEFNELLRQIGIVHKVESNIHVKDKKSENQITQNDIIEAVILDSPDLVKEYLVLWQAFERGQLNILFPKDWDNNFEQLIFIGRLLIDYPEKLEENNQFWIIFFGAAPKSEFSAWIYGSLLFVVTLQLPRIKKQAFERLKELHEQYPGSEKIASEYGKGLVNLTVAQEVDDCEESIEKLRKLHEQYPGSEEIASKYGKGLVNLTVAQEVDDCEESIEKLRKLHEQYSGSEEIASKYGKGLVNLTVDQEVDDCKESIEKLRKLHEQYPGSEEIASKYGKGLVRLTVAQEVDDCEESIEKLRKLHEQYPGSEEIAVIYASSLVNLSFEQTKEDDIQNSIGQVKKLLMKYHQNTEIQLSYAETLFNLTLKQESDALHRTVAQIREFLLAYSEVNKRFQNALNTYLSEHQDHTERYISLII